MNKQQTANILKKEIILINNTLSRLNVVYNQTTDDLQARDLNIAINQLIAHKQNLEKLIAHTLNDNKQVNPSMDR